MRSLFLSCVILLAGRAADGSGPIFPTHSADTRDFVINEVYYDHPGVDQGWEFIELYNNGAAELSLYGARLEFVDGRTGSITVVWSCVGDIVMKPGEFILVAGKERHPKEGFSLSGSLGNGPDCVALVSGDEKVDRVGYGSLEWPDLFETAPAPDVDAGRSLSRKPDGMDTQDNSGDFAPADPSPGRRNYFDFDLGLLPEGPGLLACDGVPADFRLIVRNDGLSVFSGIFTIDISNAQPGGFFRLEKETSLVPGTSLDLALRLPGAFSIGRPFFSVLESALDSNPSNDTLVTTVSISPGEIVINEIMYRPFENESEWFEIYNRSPNDIDLLGWRVADALSPGRSISGESLIVRAGSFVVLAQKPSLFTVEFPDCPAAVAGGAGGWLTLNDCTENGSTETLSIFDAEGVMVEAARYAGLLGYERGRSLERFSPDACSSLEGGIWHRCPAAGRATPGMVNSSNTEGSIPAGEVSVSPESLMPARGGSAVISGARLPGEAGFAITIFDMNGAVVRRILAEEDGAAVFSAVWDGRSASGGIVTTGLYLCVVEFLAPGGGVCRRVKRCIAVSDGG